MLLFLERELRDGTKKDPRWQPRGREENYASGETVSKTDLKAEGAPAMRQAHAGAAMANSSWQTAKSMPYAPTRNRFRVGFESKRTLISPEALKSCGKDKAWYLFSC